MLVLCNIHSATTPQYNLRLYMLGLFGMTQHGKGWQAVVPDFTIASSIFQHTITLSGRPTIIGIHRYTIDTHMCRPRSGLLTVNHVAV